MSNRLSHGCCCGCTLFASNLSNAAQFDANEDDTVFTSRFTLPTPDYQVWFGNLLNNTIATSGFRTSNWLYRDGRWFTIEIVESPGEEETVHFSQTFRTARQSGFYTGELFASVYAQSLLDATALTFVPPTTINAHIIYSDGTLGPLLHGVSRYPQGSTDDGYIGASPALDPIPLLSDPFIRVRDGFIELVGALDADAGLSLSRILQQGRQFLPFEHRVEIPDGCHVRCSFSEPKDGVFLWSKIQSSELDKPISCQRYEACANSPEKNKPKWQITSFEATPATRYPFVGYFANQCVTRETSEDVSLAEFNWTMTRSGAFVSASPLSVTPKYAVDSRLSLLPGPTPETRIVEALITIRSRIADPRWEPPFTESTTGSTIYRIQTNRDYYAEGVNVFNLQGSPPLAVRRSRQLTYRKTIPIYEGLDPPELTFSSADLVDTGDITGDSLFPGLPTGPNAITPILMLSELAASTVGTSVFIDVSYEAIIPSYITFVASPFGPDVTP